MRYLKNALLALVCLALAVITAKAAGPFDAKAFETAQVAGRTILIDVTAPWCPVCRRQKPTIESLQIDFDTAKDVLKRFRVTQQSTLIVFKGRNEVGRSTGDTDHARIRKLVASGF